MAKNYKATAAQARYIAFLAREKSWTVDDLKNNYHDVADTLGEGGSSYWGGQTFVQVGRAMNKKAASKFIDLLLDDSAEWAFPETDTEPADAPLAPQDENEAPVVVAVVAHTSLVDEPKADSDWTGVAGYVWDRAPKNDANRAKLHAIYVDAKRNGYIALAEDLFETLHIQCAGAKVPDWVAEQYAMPTDQLRRLAAFPGYEMSTSGSAVLWIDANDNTPMCVTETDDGLLRVRKAGTPEPGDQVGVPFVLSRWPSQAYAAENAEYADLDEALELDELVEAMCE